MKRPTPSMAVALVALFVALGGTSIAASRYLITNANQISPHATYQLAVALSHKLRAQAGEQGMPGSEGPQGRQGVTGTTRVVFEGSIGPQGKTGATGERGEKGEEGRPGPDLFFISQWCQSGVHDSETWIENNVTKEGLKKLIGIEPSAEVVAVARAVGLGLLQFQWLAPPCRETHTP